MNTKLFDSVMDLDTAAWRAACLVLEAERKIEPRMWVFEPPQKSYEEASGLFKEAAAQFMISESWLAAGNAFSSAAECFKKSDAPYKSYQALESAADCFKRTTGEEAESERLRCSLAAIDGFINGGHILEAAKYTSELANEFYENGDPRRASTLYTRAAHFFYCVDKPTEATVCLSSAEMLSDLVANRDGTRFSFSQ